MSIFPNHTISNTTLSHFPLTEYRFYFSAKSHFLLPEYTGSAWRGLFGHALKRTVCITQQKHCPDCLLSSQCVYRYIFETPTTNSSIMGNYPAAPHPFIIRPNPQQAKVVNKGDDLLIDLVLIGRAKQHLPYLIHALQQAGKQGIGFQRGKFSLRLIQQHTVEGKQDIYQPDKSLKTLTQPLLTIPSLPQGKITLTFTTPFRNVQQGKLTTEHNLCFYTLLSPLMRRFSLLSHFHTDFSFQPNFKQLTAIAKEVQLQDKALYWQPWQRYSSRQKTSINMGGVMGSITLNARDLAPFWQMLVLGQLIHIGKVTVMGLGRYHLYNEKKQPISIY